jgi:hypothetical protein
VRALGYYLARYGAAGILSDAAEADRGRAITDARLRHDLRAAIVQVASSLAHGARPEPLVAQLRARLDRMDAAYRGRAA